MINKKINKSFDDRIVDSVVSQIINELGGVKDVNKVRQAVVNVLENMDYITRKTPDNLIGSVNLDVVDNHGIRRTVDLNLKVLKNGYYNVCLSNVEMLHYESKSRGYEASSEKHSRFLKEQEYMKKKWGNYIKKDNFFSKNIFWKLKEE